MKKRPSKKSKNRNTQASQDWRAEAMRKAMEEMRRAKAQGKNTTSQEPEKPRPRTDRHLDHSANRRKAKASNPKSRRVGIDRMRESLARAGAKTSRKSTPKREIARMESKINEETKDLRKRITRLREEFNCSRSGRQFEGKAVRPEHEILAELNPLQLKYNEKREPLDRIKRREFGVNPEDLA
jgi:hypothetical protein